MEVAVQEFVDEPAGYAGAANGGHLFRDACGGVAVDIWGQPWRDSAPVFADVEGEVVDGAVKAREAGGVFVVIEGGAGLGEALVGEGVLELLDLGVFIEVVFFYFAVFIIWSMSVRSQNCDICVLTH